MTSPFVSAHPARHLYDKYHHVLEKARDAFQAREFYAHYPEAPSPKVYGEEADGQGKQRYQDQLGKQFNRLVQLGDHWLVSDERSPYTGLQLGISYPAFTHTARYIAEAERVFPSWRASDITTRAGILIEALERMKASFFEIAYATMHTTGQAYMMSFQASGPHAADRALEAIAVGYDELTRYPGALTWTKPGSKGDTRLHKYFTAVPRGIALTIGCSTFPIWNSAPGIFASLVTGNPVIVKPHPQAIYPVALVVAALQEVLVENGLDPAICQLAPDNDAHLITKELAEDPAVKIIDFTGSSSFGSYVEGLPGKITFTEKTGVNSVILDSCNDLASVVQNLATSVSLYSGQMCTAPQNFFIPQSGIMVAGKQVPYAEVVKAFTDAIHGLANNPKAGPAILGAIQSDATCRRIEDASKLPGKVLLPAEKISNPEFPQARLYSPLVLEVQATEASVYQQELFGPILFIIPTKDTHQSVQLAKQSAQQHGAISCAAYTTNADTLAMIANEMAEAATPVAFNLTGNIYVNQNAGFSDFHVSGGNPSGNASLTNPEYVLRRFTMVGVKVNPTS